nr:putative pectinesterase [Arabidopsis thaliana]
MTLFVYGYSAAAEQIAYTITVDLNGGGNFTTVQSAIDSISPPNHNWIRVFTQNGIYRMLGDRYVVTDSSFVGLQDTLFDGKGRHYYKRCIISGGIDFIFGYGQSLFKECTLNMTLGIYAPDNPYGTITAHQRPSPSDEGGFVFSDCTVTGVGKTLLGRAWGSNARVIFDRSRLSDVVLPIGWDAWRAKGNERDLTFVEAGCTGAGADTSQRVPWLKKLSLSEVDGFASVSFIDQDGWISRFPIEGGP